MRMLGAVMLTVLSLSAWADEIDGVIFLLDPGRGFYVIDTNTDLYSFCTSHSPACTGPWSLPLPLPLVDLSVEDLIIIPPFEPSEAELESDY